MSSIASCVPWCLSFISQFFNVIDSRMLAVKRVLSNLTTRDNSGHGKHNRFGAT